MWNKQIMVGKKVLVQQEALEVALRHGPESALHCGRKQGRLGGGFRQGSLLLSEEMLGAGDPSSDLTS